MIKVISLQVREGQLSCRGAYVKGYPPALSILCTVMLYGHMQSYSG
jgi:hypothetical protein